MCKRQDIEGDCCTVPFGKRKNPHDAFVNLDGAIGSLVSCEIYQKINVHKTSIYSYIYRPYWCRKNTSVSRYDRDPMQQAF